MTSAIQVLCISMPETSIHVTLKRRAEISADIFARLRGISACLARI